MKGRQILFTIAFSFLGGFAAVILTLHGALPFVAKAACDQGPCPPNDPQCPGPCGNGDANGSGGIDMADPIYLLSYLFADGPAPVAFANGGCCLTPEQEEILSYFSMVDLPTDDQGGTARTIRITGVNLQIVNGLNATNGYPQNPHSLVPDETVTNSVGNLIVGYQELAESLKRPNERTGSHNLIIGIEHNYTWFGGLAAGAVNLKRIDIRDDKKKPKPPSPPPPPDDDDPLF